MVLRPSARAWQLAVLLAIVSSLSFVAAAPAAGDGHPRLLIRAADVPRLRHACGLGGAPASNEAGQRAGAHAAEFQALRAHFAERADIEVLPGELAAAAFLHLVNPDDPLDRTRVALIGRVLLQPLWMNADPFETVLALDWCWEALEPAARQEFLLALRKQASPLGPADTPLDHRTYIRKLATLAAAFAIDEQDDPSPTWASLRGKVLAGGRTYLQSTFPTYVAWRGCSPTSPSEGPWEERDAALSIELAGCLVGGDVWGDYRATVARWLEHYVFSSFAHPALQHPFIRDDGSLAPLTPAPQWDDMLPLTAHLLAVRTKDPAAVFIARRVEQLLRGRTAPPLAVPWQWVPIVFEIGGVAPCDFARLPTARNFGGATVFRGRCGPGEVGVWIGAGQPYLRPRQHFDAGHFLIYSDGELAVGGGDDVALEAVPAKGGEQHLGESREAFEFEQYFAATIAHNCLLLWDPIRVPRWYGKLYEPAGGQRLIEGLCTDFPGPVEGTARQTARQVAYGQRDTAAYLKVDLLPAYEPRTATAYTREYVFLSGSALVVIDRLSMRGSRAKPVWVLNIPARPTVDGRDLVATARVEGSGNDAGVWNCDAAGSLRWRSADGALWCCPLLPSPRTLRVVGGPATQLPIPEGPYAGRTYVGGDAHSFEHIVRPTAHAHPQNAWYRLVGPTLLGPTFGTTPHWGRLEIEPAQAADANTFVTVLVVETEGARRPPSATLQQAEGEFVLTLDTGVDRSVLRMPAGDAGGGKAEYPDGQGEPWTLPTTVEPDAPLPTE